jgi:hypothetical protein
MEYRKPDGNTVPGRHADLEGAEEWTICGCSLSTRKS